MTSDLKLPWTLDGYGCARDRDGYRVPANVGSHPAVVAAVNATQGSNTTQKAEPTAATIVDLALPWSIDVDDHLDPTGTRIIVDASGRMVAHANGRDKQAIAEAICAAMNASATSGSSAHAECVGHHHEHQHGRMVPRRDPRIADVNVDCVTRLRGQASVYTIVKVPSGEPIASATKPSDAWDRAAWYEGAVMMVKS